MWQIVVMWKPGLGPTNIVDGLRPDDPYENTERMMLDDNHYNSIKPMALAAAQFMSTYPQVEWAQVVPVRINDIPVRFSGGERVPVLWRCCTTT